LILEVQNKVRQLSGCLRHPESEQKEKIRKVIELARREMADPSLFMVIAKRLRVAPPTELVGKNQENHRFSFVFPVVIKPFDGRKMIVARNQSEIMQVTGGLKAAGYQIQKYLQGYTFLKVRVENGFIEDGHSTYVRGAIRRLVNLHVTQGVHDFTLTVATNHVVTYVVGARLN
jgi:hypothetical protein